MLTLLNGGPEVLPSQRGKVPDGRLEKQDCGPPARLSVIWVAPRVSACSSLYQALIVRPDPVRTVAPLTGSNALSTVLSLKTTVVRGKPGSAEDNGYPQLSAD